MKNNRGYLDPISLAVGAAALFFGVLLLIRPPHIVKKAAAKCVSEANVSGSDSTNCLDTVNSWTQEQRIEYIRDK